jgi:hypothetical protein
MAYPSYCVVDLDEVTLAVMFPQIRDGVDGRRPVEMPVMHRTGFS